MANNTKIRTINFLPEIFQTPTNRQFLAATLDKLVQQPNLERREGFIGTRVGTGVNSLDYYVPEPDKIRTDYQLEPALTFLQENTDQVRDALTYPGFLDALSVQGANVENHQRLWQNETYAWDPMINLDPLVNYTQYYWLPYGPDSVIVSPSNVYSRANYTITDQITALEITGYDSINPPLTLLRGGTYTFTVDQNEGFWIQGVQGLNPIVDNTNTRDVLGVNNNGTANGVITFRVPELTAQDQYYNLKDRNYSADLVTTKSYDEFFTQEVSVFDITIGVDTIDGTGVDLNRALITEWNSGETVIRSGSVITGVNNETGAAIAAGSILGYYYDPAIIPGDPRYFEPTANVDQPAPTDLLNYIRSIPAQTQALSDRASRLYGIANEAKYGRIPYTSNAIANISLMVTDINNENPGQVTFTPVVDTVLADGFRITFADVGGMTQVNGNTYYLGNLNLVVGTADLYLDAELTIPADTGTFDPYTSGGILYPTDRIQTFEYAYNLAQQLGAESSALNQIYDNFYNPGGNGYYYIHTPQQITPQQITVPNAASVVYTGITLADLGGSIDGVTDINGKTIIFYNDSDTTHNGSLYRITLSPTTVVTYDTTPNDTEFYDQRRQINFEFVESFFVDTKIEIISGDTWAGRIFYRDINRNNLLTLVPYLSARSNTLYYQKDNFSTAYGIINIIDLNSDAVIDVERDILGKINYQSPNGVKFTNGLKVFFDGNVTPDTYVGQEYYVAGVGTAITLVPVVDLVPYEPYSELDYIPWDARNNWDERVWDVQLYIARYPDYITIARESFNNNPWSRSNRWFHSDVINATALYNRTETGAKNINLNAARAQRPIIEFRPNLKLYQSGYTSTLPVDYIDTTLTDAFAQVSGPTYLNVVSVSVDNNSVNVLDALNPRFKIGTPLQFSGTSLGQRQYTIADISNTVPARITFDAPALNISTGDSLFLNYLQSPPAKYADIVNITQTTTAIVTVLNQQPEPMETGDRIYISGVLGMGRTASAPAGYLPTINNNQFFETTPYYVKLIGPNASDPRATDYEIYFDSDLMQPVNTFYYSRYVPFSGGRTYAIYRGTWNSLNFDTYYASFYLNTGYTGQKSNINTANLIIVGDVTGVFSTNDTISFLPEPSNTYNIESITFNGTNTVITVDTEITETGNLTVYRLDNSKLNVEIYGTKTEANIISPFSAVDGTEQGEYIRNSGRAGYGPTGLEIGVQYYIDKILDRNSISLRDAQGNTLIIPESQAVSDYPIPTPTLSNDVPYSPDGDPANPQDRGYDVVNGSRVIFAADNNIEIRNRIWQVNFVNIDDVRPVLILEDVGFVNTGSQTIVRAGYTQAGKSWYFDGDRWQPAQSKTQRNQPPLFDVYDNSGVSYSDYNNSTFAGCKLFSYALGAGINDPILGFPIKYESVGVIGDIKFTVDLNTDTFVWTQNNTNVTVEVDSGYVHEYTTPADYKRLIGWVPTVAASVQPQIFEFIYDSVNIEQTFVCDIPATPQSIGTWQSVQVYVNNEFLTRFPVGVEQVPANANYTIELGALSTSITINTANMIINAGTPVQIYIISDLTSATAYYQVPSNLSSNPFNINLQELTLGDVKGQYASIVQNYTGAIAVAGYVFGNNNYRDIGDVLGYGAKIIQNSASLALPGVFLREPDYSIFDALEYNSREYVKFKNLLISTVDAGDYDGYATAGTVLDLALDTIASTKSETSAFFWSDMIVNRAPYITNRYTVTLDTNQVIYSLSRIYDYTSANYQGLSVYLTAVVNAERETFQLLSGVDYTVSSTEPAITIHRVLNIGDIITVNEYNQTYGSYVPNTPTKLGLYPGFAPAVVYDESYINPVWVIVGHDGSRTKLYGDYVNGYLTDLRDRVILEFEYRVYNNLKVQYTGAVRRETVVPGQFRTTDYTDATVRAITSTGILNWMGQNRINYRDHYYVDSNEFTYNYRTSTNRLNNSAIAQGHWRGIYLWLYDTDTPNTTPWEMLGLTVEPSWWVERYGSAPYTSDNLVLWNDLAAGRIYNGSDAASIIDLRYQRPRLLECLPVDECGNLVSPLNNIIRDFDARKFPDVWAVGDVSPAESAYYTSSTWPFDLQRLLILTKPAQWFNYYADVDLYRYSTEFDQYLYQNRDHLNPAQLQIYGDGTAKHSYINWIVDYTKQIGQDGTTLISERLKNLNVQLAYRMAGFTSEVLTDFIIDKASTNSVGNFRIPDTDYTLLLYKNQDFDQIYYSSVIVQKTISGWAVYGNSQRVAYFTAYTPRYDSQTTNITAGSQTVSVTKNYDTRTRIIPYGYVFTSIDQVCQFMIDYGRYLNTQGVIYLGADGETTDGWYTAAQEFLLWSQVSWSIGSTANFNPAHRTFAVDKPSAIVQPLTLGRQNLILNQNLIPINTDSACIERADTLFKVTILNERDTIAYTQLNVSNYEHTSVFKNRTSFGDLIYDPITGLRQPRLYLEARVSAEWNGAVDAQGFIFNIDNVPEWDPNLAYRRGSLVKFKNRYWVASTNIAANREFQSNQWTESDYGQVTTGILPNLSTRAFESTLYYNTTQSNLSTDADLLGYSLIGFRPREYLALANFDLLSQVNIYKTMIKEKGTNAIAEAFKGAEFKQGAVDYDIYENWAIKNGEYGGVKTENYIDFVLDQALLTGNPNTVKFINDQTDSSSTVQQNVLISDLWDYANPVTAPHVLPVLSEIAFDRVISAGYVSFRDVKFAAYNRLDFNLNSAVLPNTFKGDYLWVANDISGWQVYTAVSIGTVVTEIKNNLNGTSTVVFDSAHNLSADNFISISNFDPSINGFYLVQSVIDLYQIVINTPVLDSSIRMISGQGVALRMDSVRVNSADQVINLDLLNTEFMNSLVWVDNYNSAGWALLGKNINYSRTHVLTTDGGFSSSTAYSSEIGSLLVSKLGDEVYRYDAEFNLIETLTDIGTDNITDIAVSGDTAYFAQSAASLVVVYPFRTGATPQILSGANEFGAQIAVSDNGVYLFVLSKAANAITVFVRNSAGEYTAQQLLQKPTQTNVINRNWGQSISTNADGSFLFVSDPDAAIDTGADDDIPDYNSAGLVYVFARNASTSVQDFILVQTITSPQLQSSAAFGRGMDNNSGGSELIVGSPGYTDNALIGRGAAFRLTNTARRFGQVITGEFNDNQTFTGTIFIEGYDVTANNATPAQAAAAINARVIPNLIAGVVTAASGKQQIVINRINSTTEPENDRLNVLGTQAALEQWRITVYTHTQVITEPHPQNSSGYGTTVAFDNNDSFVISAPTATAYLHTTFDQGAAESYNRTIFDQNSTDFVDLFNNTGAVYMYDYLSSADPSIYSTGSYVYAQSVNSVDTVEAGLAGITFDNYSLLIPSGNRIDVYTNSTETPDWSVVKQPVPSVNINNLTGVNIYDRNTNTVQGYLDYIDPAQGKFLSAAQQNIDYATGADPAGYSVTPNSNNQRTVWGEAQVGTVWFDVDSVRYLDTHQPELDYNAQYWGTAFPGSQANVWIWTEQSVLPVNYTGAGQVLSTTEYSTAFDADAQNNLVTRYYYWVKNDGILYSSAGKTLTSQAIASYLTNPLSSGVSFMAPITNNSLALYNSQSLINTTTPTLHVEWNTGASNDQLHRQFLMIRDGVDSDFLTGFPSLIKPVPSGLYGKYIDSLSGTQEIGFVLDSVTVTAGGQAYTSAPDILIVPAPGDRTAPQSNDPNAATAVAQVANGSVINIVFTDTGSGYTLTPLIQIIGGGGGGATAIINTSPSYITVPDTDLTPPRRYGVSYSPNQTMFLNRTSAVENFSEYVNRILAQTPAVELNTYPFLSESGAAYIDNVRVEFDTTDYWQYTNWWVTGYDDNTKVTIEVQEIYQLDELNLKIGEVAKVVFGGVSTSEYYVYTAAGFERIGVENGTIQLLPELWQDSTAMLPARWIARAVNEQIFADSLLINRNQLLTLMFDYAQTEAMDSQNYLPWLSKTSLVDVISTVRELLPYTSYQPDNTAFLEGYLNEVKPFHVLIKTFSFKYSGIDTYYGHITDFDLPAQYQSAKGTTISPQLVYEASQLNEFSYLPDDPIWQTSEYTDWFSTYGLAVTPDSDEYTPVATLSLFIDNISNYMEVDSTSGLSQQGVLLIDNEYIGYTNIDRDNSRILGLQRGFFTSEPASHNPGAVISTRKLGIIILDGARGYYEPPAITLSLDTELYPPATVSAIRPPALESQVINPGPNGQLIFVEIADAGAGYPALPTLEIESSNISALFDSVDVNTYTAVGAIASTIRMVNNPFRTGDPVRIVQSLTGTLPFGLITGQIYYLGKPLLVTEESGAGNLNAVEYVAFYLNKADALIDRNRIRLNSTGTGTGHSLAVTALGVVSMSSPLIRKNKTVLKYDRVSYQSIIRDWQPGFAYVGGDQSGAVTKASSSQPSSYGQTLASIEAVPGYTSADFLASNAPTTALPIRAVILSNPVVITTTVPHQIVNNTVVRILNVQGTTELNEQNYYAQALTSTSIKLYYDVELTQPVDGRGFEPYSGSGVVIAPVETSFAQSPSLVLYNGTVWRCVVSNFDDYFDINKWSVVSSSDPELTALDRIAGWYRPTSTQPGKASQLVSGIEYPNATFLGQSFTGLLRLDTQLLSVNNTNSSLNYYDVSGGEFTDGYAPAELVAGVVQDNLLFNVTTRPGSSWREREFTNISVSNVSITAGGIGYQTGDVIRFLPPPQGVGVLQAIVSNVAANGAITSFALGNIQAAAFNTAPNAVITAGATFSATLGLQGAVEKIELQTSGSGYTDIANTQIVIDSPSRGRTAQARITEITGGAVLGVELTDGGTGYGSAPRVSIIDLNSDPANNIGGSGATVVSQLFTGVTVPQDQVDVINVLLPGTGYITGDLVEFNTPNLSLTTTANTEQSTQILVANNQGIVSGMTVTGTGAFKTVRVVDLPDYERIVLDTAVTLSTGSNLTFTGVAAAATIIADNTGAVIDTFITNVGRGYSTLVPATPTAAINSAGTGANLVVNTKTNYYSYTGFGLIDVSTVATGANTFSFAVDGVDPAAVIVYVRTTDTQLRPSARRLYEGLDYTVDWAEMTVTLTARGQTYLITGATLQAQVATVGGGNHLIDTNSNETPFVPVNTQLGNYTQVDLDVPYQYLQNPQAGLTIPNTEFVARDISAPDVNIAGGTRTFARPWSAPLITENSSPLNYYSLIDDITITEAGSGYDPLRPPQVRIPLPGQANAVAIINQDDFGSGEFTATESGGVVDSITIVDGGTGYFTIPVVQIVDDGGPGTGATAVVTNVGIGGVVTGIQVTNGGSGYVSPVVRLLRGSILNVVLDRSGYGYDFVNPPSVRIQGDGTGALASATVIPENETNEGSLLRVTLLASGSGYTTATVVIDPPQFQGIPATAAASVDPANGSISSITLLNPGLGYYPDPLSGETAPAITVDPSGQQLSTPATAEFANRSNYLSDYQIIEHPSDPHRTLLEFSTVLDTDSNYYEIILLGTKFPSGALSWSLPVTQRFDIVDPNRTNYPLSNYAGGTNPENAVVEINGFRLIPGVFSLTYETVTNEDQYGYLAPILLSDVATFTDSIFFNYTDPDTSDSTDAVVLVGSNGSIVKATQYPWVWSDKVSDTALDIRAIAGNDDYSVIVAVGDQGLVLVSTDFAETWTQITPAPTSVKLNSVVYDPNTQSWIAVGDQGLYVRGNNDASNWTNTDSQGRTLIIDVFSWGGSIPAKIALPLEAANGVITAVQFAADREGNRWQGQGFTIEPLVEIINVSDGYLNTGNGTLSPEQGTFTQFSAGNGAQITAQIGTRRYDGKFSGDIVNQTLSNVSVSAGNLTVGQTISGFIEAQFTANFYTTGAQARMTVSNVSTDLQLGPIRLGAKVSGAGVGNNVYISSQLSGNIGLDGEYRLSSGNLTANGVATTATYRDIITGDLILLEDLGGNSWTVGSAEFEAQTGNAFTVTRLVETGNTTLVVGSITGIETNMLVVNSANSIPANTRIQSIETTAPYSITLTNAITANINQGDQIQVGDGNTITINKIVRGAVKTESLLSGSNLAANTRLLEQRTFNVSNVTVTGDVATWTGGPDDAGVPEVGMNLLGVGFRSGTKVQQVLGPSSIKLNAARGISFVGYIEADIFSPITNISTLHVVNVFEGVLDTGITITGSGVPANANITITQLGAGTYGGVGTYQVTSNISIGGPSDTIIFAPRPFEMLGIAGIRNDVGTYTLSEPQLLPGILTVYQSTEQSIPAANSILLAQKDPLFTAITGFTIVSAGSGYNPGTRIKITPNVLDRFAIVPKTEVITTSKTLAGNAYIVERGEEYLANAEVSIQPARFYQITDYTTSGNGVGAVFNIGVDTTGNYTLVTNSPSANGVFFGGVNFNTSDTITVAGNLLGGGANAVLTVGNVTANTLGQAAGSIIDISSITGAANTTVTGTSANISITVANAAVTAVTVNDTGSNYVAPAIVTVTGIVNSDTGVQQNQNWDIELWDRNPPDMNSITVDGNTAVVAGTAGLIFYSNLAVDLNWLQSTVYTLNDFNRVRWIDDGANTQFVAVGNSGTIAVSDDGADWTNITTEISDLQIQSIEVYNNTDPALITLNSITGLSNGDEVQLFNVIPTNTEYYNVTNISREIVNRKLYAGNVGDVANTARLYIDSALTNGVTLESLGLATNININTIQGDGNIVTLDYLMQTEIPPIYVGQRVFIDGTDIVGYNDKTYTVVGYYNDDANQGLQLTGSSETQAGVDGYLVTNFTITPKTGAILTGGGSLTNTAATLTDLRFDTIEDEYVVVGTSGTIITNTGNNFANTWSTQSTGTTRNLYSIVYADNTVPTANPDWFLGSDFGSIWRTDDYETTGSWTLTDTKAFDINRLTVYLNGVELTYGVQYELNFFAPYYQATWSGEYGGTEGIYSSTPWDPVRIYVILAAAPVIGSIVRITYETTSPSYIISDQNIQIRVPITTGDTVGVTTFHDTSEQSLDTLYFSGITVSLIDNLETNFDPVIVDTVNEHNLVSGQAVRIDGIDGGAIGSRLNGNVYFVNVITATRVQLYLNSALNIPLSGLDTGNWISGGYIWPAAGFNLGQTDWTLDDTQRLWVTLNGRRIWSDLLRLYDDNELGILLPIAREDDVVITSMTPRATPEELSFIVQVADTVDTKISLSVQTVDVNTSTGAGAVSSTGWTVAPEVFFTLPDLAGGRRATGTALLGYGIQSVAITNNGQNYTNPVVTVSAPEYSSGVAAVAVAQVENGLIQSIQILSAGAGYSQSQTVTITVTDNTGTGFAAGTVTLTSSGTVSAVEITDSGRGYTVAPRVYSSYVGPLTVPDFRVNVVSEGSILGDVYNTNARYRTWLTEPIDYVTNTIYVHDASRIVNIVSASGNVRVDTGSTACFDLPQQHDYLTLTYVSVTVDDVLIDPEDYYVSTRNRDSASGDDPEEGQYRVFFTDSSGITTGTIAVTLGFGNRVKIQSEIVEFARIDLTNNTLSGLRRGVDRSVPVTDAPAYTLVQSYSSWNQQPQYYYTDSWTDYKDGPLQTSENPAALFLKQ